MRAGTFVALNKNTTYFLQNDSDFDRVRGVVSNGKLTITSENAEGTSVIHWMVVGERADVHMKGPENKMTNENGSLLTEYIREEQAPY